MFRYKALLEANVAELAAIITRHHGKTLDEARGEVRRGIEVIDLGIRGNRVFKVRARTP